VIHTESVTCTIFVIKLNKILFLFSIEVILFYEEQVFTYKDVDFFLIRQNDDVQVKSIELTKIVRLFLALHQHG